MGQGYSLASLPAGSTGIDVAELSDLTFEKTLGSGRFMKSIRARHHDGVVFVKLVTKPNSQTSLEKYSRAIRRERKALADVPNALGYKRDLETSTNGYLVRQFQYSSLYDRLSTRPFLEEIEKKWLAFQLLCAIRDCHARDVYHGDIKTENVLVTSWNWLYLVDFSSSFKPTFLPEDNPADFSYFFDNSGRRTCYLAPERFLLPGEKAQSGARTTWAMDIFSVGCVIAELFVEAPIFSLSQLFKYRKGEYDPNHAHLSRIGDENIRELVSHMIQVDPESRYSADDYLKFWRQKAFPDYFYSFLHQYMEIITDPSSGRAPVTAQSKNLGETDDRINRVALDFDKISYFLGFGNTGELKITNPTRDNQPNETLPICIEIPNNRHFASRSKVAPSSDDGTLIFATLVASSIRNTARAASRVQACDLLLAFAERLTDEAKLDRVLPYIVTLLSDESDAVKAAAVRSLTQLMALVTVVSPVNAYIFPEYVLPRLESFVLSRLYQPRAIVRSTYAACLSTLADTAIRFLEMVQALNADGSLPTAEPEPDDGSSDESAHQNMFESAKNSLVYFFEAHCKALLTDPDASVRRAFLKSVTRLCAFFGTSKANDVILTHLITYLNDKDWILRLAFFEAIVGVATFVGSTSLEEYILPLMTQALVDPEDFVVERALRSFAAIVKLGLLQRSKIWELVDIIGRFTMHPNIWIRQAAASYLSVSTTILSPADTVCILSPLLKPYLKYSTLDLSELKILNALKRPLPRLVFDMAARWSIDPGPSSFWKPVQKHHTFTFGPANESVTAVSARDLNENALKKVSRNSKDEQWLVRLRNIGMAKDDEWKLVALREYIYKMAHSTAKTEIEKSIVKDLSNIVKLQSLNIVPETILFEDDSATQTSTSPMSNDLNDFYAQPRSIADALLDASRSTEDPLGRRKLSYANSRRAKENGNGRASSIPTRKERDLARRTSSHSPAPTHLHVEDQINSPTISIQSSDTESQQEVPASHTNDQISGRDENERLPKRKTIQHKGSAVNLLNRKDLAKATAETGMTSTNASGTVESTRSPSQPRITAFDEARDGNKRYRASHTYEGHDPSILKLLDHLSLENHQIENVEFGPIVQSISAQEHIKKNNGQSEDQRWHPEGTLVATFSEHTAAINKVIVAPDHSFFLTASDDGTVKVWDTSRLESDVSHRSRQTHKHDPNAQVKALCFVESTHCFASGATDGSIHVVKVDSHSVSGSIRYNKLRLLRDYYLPSDSSYAVCLTTYKPESNPVLLIATSTSQIIALDLRTMTTNFVLTSPLHHGPPTTFTLDTSPSGPHWLLLATAHGILSLYDLRFRLRLKSFGLPGATPIHALTPHPSKGRSLWVIVAGGTGYPELTTWDVERSICREVYRASASPSASSAPPKDTAKTYAPWSPDADPPETTIARFAAALEPASSNTDVGIRALVAAFDSDEHVDPSNPAHVAAARNINRGPGAFLLTGGADRRLRYWDLYRPEVSNVFSGLDADEQRPSYAVSNPEGLFIVAEKPGSGSAARSGKGYGSGGARTVISLQAQELLRRHLDCITDVAILRRPYGMCVSVDRSGVIYVFQ